MGLIQRAIEAAGIATIAITLMPWVTEKVKVPRAVALEFPLGHTVGKPFERQQQKTILREAFRALETIEKPGIIVELPYKWETAGQDSGEK